MLSNCLISALGAKAIHPIKVKVFFVNPNSKDEKGVPHFIWHNGTIYKHYTWNKAKSHKMRDWYKFILFYGHIDKFPVNYLCYVKLKRIL